MLEDILKIGKNDKDNLVLSIKYTKEGKKPDLHLIPIGDRLKRVILKTLYNELMNMKPNKHIEFGIMDAIKTMKLCKTKED